MFCTSCFIIGIFAFNVFFERKKRYIWENPIFSVIALLSFAPEVQTAGHAALSKAAFFYCLFCEYLFWYDWTNRKNLFSSAAKYRFLFYFYVRLFCVSVCCDHIENIMRIFSDLTKFLFRFSFSVSLSPWTRFFIWF